MTRFSMKPTYWMEAEGLLPRLLPYWVNTAGMEGMAL